MVKTLNVIDTTDAYWARARCLLCIGKKTRLCIVYLRLMSHLCEPEPWPICHSCAKIYGYPLPDYMPSRALQFRCFMTYIEPEVLY